MHSMLPPMPPLRMQDGLALSERTRTKTSTFAVDTVRHWFTRSASRHEDCAVSPTPPFASCTREERIGSSSPPPLDQQAGRRLHDGSACAI